MSTYKIQLRDEIRRISMEGTPSLSNLETKVKSMFPQLDAFVLQYRKEEGGPLIDLISDEDLISEVNLIKNKKPPIFRITVAEGRSRPPAVETPVESPVETIPSSTVDICTMCNTPLDFSRGPVFECMNCENVRLCASCDEKSEHDKTHLLLKLAMPLDDMSLEQQLRYLNCIANSARRKALGERKREVKRQLREQKMTKKHKALQEKKKRKEEERARMRAEKRSKRIHPAALVSSVAEPEPQVVVADVPHELVPVAVPVEVKAVEVEVAAEVPAEVPAEEPQTVEVSSFVVVEEPAPVQNVTEEDSWTEMINGFKVLTTGLTDTLTNTINSTAQAVTGPATGEDHRIHGLALGQKLEALEGMGFTDRSKNILLLVKNLASLERTVEDLISG